MNSIQGQRPDRESDTHNKEHKINKIEWATQTLLKKIENVKYFKFHMNGTSNFTKDKERRDTRIRTKGLWSQFYYSWVQFLFLLDSIITLWNYMIDSVKMTRTGVQLTMITESSRSCSCVTRRRTVSQPKQTNMDISRTQNSFIYHPIIRQKCCWL